MRSLPLGMTRSQHDLAAASRSRLCPHERRSSVGKPMTTRRRQGMTAPPQGKKNVARDKRNAASNANDNNTGKVTSSDRAASAGASDQRAQTGTRGAAKRRGDGAKSSRPARARTSQQGAGAASPGSAPLGPGERLQKVLAAAGAGSRRQIDAAIEAGRVTVDGAVAVPGQRVHGTEHITVEGQQIRLAATAEPTRVLLYHKPVGVVCSRVDDEGRATCFDALPPLPRGRWLSIGRLDIATSGLLLFTNDGELAHRLAHPSACIDREYVVRVRGEVLPEAVEALTTGVELEDGPAKFSDVTEGRSEGSHRWYYVTLFEGRNREVRRLWESQGLSVSRLKRARFGPISLPSRVKRGDYLELDHNDVAELSGLVDYQPPVLPKQVRRRPGTKLEASLLVPYPDQEARRRLAPGPKGS